jgi:aminoglycoside 6'-N-acetyltransferase
VTGSAALRLTGNLVTLRSAGLKDVPALNAVIADPTVAQWWGTPGSTDFASNLQREDEVIFVIEVDGQVAGLIQYSEEGEPDYRSAGIDISLKAPWQGRGLGGDAIRALCRYLFAERGHHRLTIDPAAHNARAIACYERVGFRPDGIMRKYERGSDGTWHDGLLMDLLREEFEPDGSRPAG